MKAPRSIWLLVAWIVLSAAVYFWGISTVGAPGLLATLWPLLTPGFLLQFLLGGGHAGFGGWREPLVVIMGAGLFWAVASLLLLRLIGRPRRERPAA